MMFFFFFNDTATTEIYTLSLHDALPISTGPPRARAHSVCSRLAAQPPQARDLRGLPALRPALRSRARYSIGRPRSEEHTSELQSRQYLVCRLLLEKKKKKKPHTIESINH